MTTRPSPAPAALVAGEHEAARHGGWPGGSAASLAGTRELLRFALRRDRILLPAWIYVLTVVALSAGYGIRLVYTTTASRMRLAAGVRADPTLSFIYGQLHGTTPGAIAAWRYLAYASLAAGLMSIFLVVRHTRADEESCRLELIGSTVVGRSAALAVAMLVSLMASLAAAATTTIVLTVSGLPAVGALAFALGEAGCLVFATVAAIAAQMSGTARGARGIAITALAVAFALRAAGDAAAASGPSFLTWLSPIGWAEVVRPFTGDRWWVLALPAASAVAGVVGTVALAGRRDQGAGLIAQRPGRPRASRWLSGPAGLAWRLQRGTLAAWTVGFLLAGLAIGAVGRGIGQLVGSSGGVDSALGKIGGLHGLTSAYLAACMSLLGLVAAGYAVAAVLRLSAEETAQRVEPPLAAGAGRLRWGASHLLVAVTGTGIVLAAGGLGAGLGYGLSISQPGPQLARLLPAALAQWPAALCVAGVAALLIGLRPAWSVPGGWTAFGICGLVGVLGPALNLPQGVLDLSPFTHVPRLPGGAFSIVPLLWLTAFVLAAVLAAAAGLRRRDIVTG
jgi:ABC-2 type transport system permease protein